MKGVLILHLLMRIKKIT
ncbi:hypothetical protein Goarm_012219 [Gossypium armourianum]|uniref:Uncharacterized protein n=1 Tax=Gossypium armourianum TaxID=34283 RepID=A0A7J9IZB9_9ROSI|nr:hypothetical protein [Gossypium armourianum]